MNSSKLYTSEEYVRFRPQYPGELFEFLLAHSPGTRLAWDCATGSGQCAVELARHFRRVVATDMDPEQLSHAPALPNIEYQVSSAASSPLESSSADLVAVATAAHWFPLSDFFREADRVLVPSGLLAVWAYSYPAIDPAVDEITQRLFLDILGGWWPKGMELNLDQYRSLPFPYDELETPRLAITTEWRRPHYEGFMRSCSGYRAYLHSQNKDPLDLVRTDLVSAWPDETAIRKVAFPLWGKFGRKPG